MYYKIQVKNNLCYLLEGELKDNKLIENGNINLDIPKPFKFFNNDIISEDFQIIKSKIRENYLMGYFSTSQTTRYGKTKSKNVIYSVKPFEKNIPNFLISYGGKLKGKLIIKFKFTNWNNKLPSGTIIDVIGNMEESNLNRTLAYHYYLDFKKSKLKLFSNPLESSINRINLTELETFSIDPKNSKDIDDAISIDENYIYVHIAQPISFLTEENIKSNLKKRFSTLYLQDSEISLWGDKITIESSLLENKNRNSYTTKFDLNGNLVDSFPSIVNLNKNYWYYQVNNLLKKENHIFKKLFDISKIIFNQEILSAQKLIELWMIHTNCQIGLKLIGTESIYRVNNTDMSLEDNIKRVYYHASEYQYDDSNNNHNILECQNYLHFTSPIRRFIDNIIHYYLTYGIKINLGNLDEMNNLALNTNRFHRVLELNKKISNLAEKFDTLATVVNKFTEYDLEIFTEELGFTFYNILPKKLRNCDNKLPNLNIGDKFIVTIQKKSGFLPQDKILVISKYDLFINEKY